MMLYLMIFLVTILVFLVKTVIDLYGLLSMLRKDKETLSKANEMENSFEFIKGLH